MKKAERLNKRMRRLERLNHDPRQGTGLYLYENNAKGDLHLPKAAKDGRWVVPPNGRWEGDDYFMFLVSQTNQAKLIQVIQHEGDVMENKLILDQPQTVKASGTVEHVENPGSQKLHEGTPVDSPAEVLINEDPMSGIEIIMND